MSVSSSSSRSSENSSITDPQTGSSQSLSSLSSDVDYYSQVVFAKVRRTLTTMIVTAQLDLSLVDIAYVESSSPRYVELGGKYGSVTVAASRLRLQDGLLATLRVTRVEGMDEDAVVRSWQEAMLGRIRGAVSLARAEGSQVVTIDHNEYRIV